MRKMNLLLILLFLATSIGLSVACYPHLPEQVPSHFNFSGEPDDWTRKENIIILFPAIMMIPLLILTPIVFLMRRIPLSMINLPRKEYWMAPERREKTCASMELFFFLFSMGLCLFLLALQIATFQFALGNLDNFNTIALPALLGYLGITLMLLLWMFVRFGRIPKDDGDSAGENPYSRI